MTGCQSILPLLSLFESIESHSPPCYFKIRMGKVQVQIESVAFRGYGVARVKGKVVFIPYTVTGDQAWVEMTEEKEKYSIGRLIRIIEPSPWRVNPPCPSFGSCGGCQWQHIDYLIQCKLKKDILKDALNRLGGLKEAPSITVIPSPQSFGYRIRTQLKAKGKVLGYFQERSHRIVGIRECQIVHPLINQMISFIRMMFLPFPRVEEIEINVSPDESKGVLIFHTLSFGRGKEKVLREFLQTHALIKGIVITKKERLNIFGDPTLNVTIPLSQAREKRNLKFRISSESFSQINLEQNQTLIQTVLQFSEVNKEDRVLDLYAGVGNLTLPLAVGTKEVLGIEENRRAMEDACFNSEKNGIRNCEFIPGRVEDVLRHWKREKPDLVVLDPPRKGCKTVLDQVVRLKPKKIVYVSCDPTTFSRDLRLFSERDYSLQKLCLIDMFPQTYHMEVIGLLTH
jgi:23S rRNA (uracil1939-C5)-methyltransferase